ncbi:hypothetical protein FRUB_05178 [Fimbriiglobus ruber]|uniref:Glycosyltransferase RgtA/B/C/D-like domain-containing protein n=1 Tax=Fimbriiglobus ruber TaxID=1908690 RepID=A0A225DSW2_9BACT|nr:hypothetical protein FRUB_05178 [Fimbriiglobus ruber]
MVVVAVVLAVVGAGDHAGAWNDGSRLAAVESLVDRGTFAIDDSIYVRVPPTVDGMPRPYADTPPALNITGTLDKLLIDGRFYSDKTPVLSVLMAGLYRVWLAAGGPHAAERPDLFCWFLTLATSGLAYVLAVACVVRLGRVLGLTGGIGAAFPAAFAFATFAAVYSRVVNSHVVLLAVAAGLCLALARATRDGVTEWDRWGRPVVIGLLAGFAYAIDFGLAPGFVLGTLGYCIATYRRTLPVALVVLGMLPWVVAHHALNYAVGGTFVPANAVPQYLQWPSVNGLPGSPFTEGIMTGGLKHSPAGFVLYAADMLFGKKGFFLHNLPLLLVPGGACLLWLRRKPDRAAVGFALAVCGLGWLAYAANSTNLSGQCCSVRWFVPFLAPEFWIVGLVLRHFPRYRPDLLWLTLCGTGEGILMFWAGPWTPWMVPGYWGWVAVALVGWGVVRYRNRERKTCETADEESAHGMTQVGAGSHPAP